jgi:hypothetical protein
VSLVSLPIRSILDAMNSHAMKLGVFDKVAGHEPKNAPGSGLWAALFLGDGEAVGEVSGLNAVSGRVEVQIRITQNMLAEPQDDIDPTIADAVDALMAAYCADFTLNGLIRNVDVFGETGQRLGWRAGYVEQDHKMFRAFDVTVPMIVNDFWSLG